MIINKQTNKMSECPVGTSGNKIIGLECCKCKQEPFGAYNPKHWVLFLHTKCGYCDEENAISFKWGCGKKEEEEDKCEPDKCGVCDRDAYHQNDWHCSQGLIGPKIKEWFD